MTLGRSVAGWAAGHHMLAGAAGAGACAEPLRGLVQLLPDRCRARLG